MFKNLAFIQKIVQLFTASAQKKVRPSPAKPFSANQQQKILNEMLLAKQLTPVALASTLADYHLTTWHRQFMPCAGVRPGLYLSIFPSFHIGALSIIICRTSNQGAYVCLTSQQRIIMENQKPIQREVWEPPAGFLNAPHEHLTHPDIMEEAERSIEQYCQLHPNLTAQERHDFISLAYQRANEQFQDKQSTYTTDANLIETAIRESCEETGIDEDMLNHATIDLLQGHCFAHAFVIDYLFVIDCKDKSLPKLQTAPSSEIITSQWLPIEPFQSSSLFKYLTVNHQGEVFKIKSQDIARRLLFGIERFKNQYE